MVCELSLYNKVVLHTKKGVVVFGKVLKVWAGIPQVEESTWNVHFKLRLPTEKSKNCTIWGEMNNLVWLEQSCTRGRGCFEEREELVETMKDLEWLEKYSDCILWAKGF